jgi:hypothetical protein
MNNYVSVIINTKYKSNLNISEIQYIANSNLVYLKVNDFSI